jgi:putative transposase
MSEKFQNKYRIPSARLQSYDYSSSGMYFITICTKNRTHFFGEIENEMMIFSELGSIVTTEWIKTPTIRPDMNLELGEFVVMPNHFHAILIIGDNEYNRDIKSERDTQRRDAMNCRDAMHRASTNTNGFKPQSKNLASIIRGFKSSVTTYARKNNIPFDWQPRYHDHIIRTGADYDRISNYIINNPTNWENDTFNPKKNK